jgi:hypothetical protein
MIDLAAKMISEGRGMDLMPREANPDAPITAYRYSFYDCVFELRNTEIYTKSLLVVSQALNCFWLWCQLFVGHIFRIDNSKIPGKDSSSRRDSTVYEP